MTFKNPFTDLEFRGTRWYLAEEVDSKIEAVREFVLSRRYDIEMDIENFGMLKPVLEYFLEKEEDK